MRFSGVLTFAALVPCAVCAAQSPSQTGAVGKITDAFGDVAQKKAGGNFAPLLRRNGSPVAVFAQTTIRTGDDSAALLTLANGAILRVGANSVVRMETPGNALTVLSGQVWVRSGAKGVALATPSATAVASPNGLVGVGYDLEIDHTQVSVGAGKANVSTRGNSWTGTADAGQFVQYLRNPQPNIRLQKPVIAAQPTAHIQMWKTLRAEGWTGGKPGKLNHGTETVLRQLIGTVSIAPEGNKP